MEVYLLVSTQPGDMGPQGISGKEEANQAVKLDKSYSVGTQTGDLRSEGISWEVMVNEIVLRDEQATQVGIDGTKQVLGTRTGLKYIMD